jgi:outer membrane biosynthesis protein TonB
MSIGHIYKKPFKDEKELLLAAVEGELCLGKSPHADLQVDDWKCNGIHALIKKNHDGTYGIIDLGSYYGTRVNKKIVTSSILKNGDSLKIGDSDFIFKIKNKTSDELPLHSQKNDSLNKERDPFKQDNSLASELKTLEVAMYWGDQILEVKSFEDGSDITIGHDKSATFDIPMSASGQFNKTMKVASYHKGILSIIVPKDANGLVWTDSKTVSLDTLRFYDKKYIGKDEILLNLRLGERAHLEFGELSLSFKFVKPADRLPLNFFPRLDKVLIKFFLLIFFLYVGAGLFFMLREPNLKETTLKDVPEYLKKVIYQAGIEQAKIQQKSAIGDLVSAVGGRARSEEGKSSTKQDIEKKVEKPKEEKNKKEDVKTKNKNKNKKDLQVVKADNKKSQPEVSQVKVNLEDAFKSTDSSATLATQTSIVSQVKKQGNTASALSESGFARGKSGLGAGGGGKSVGIGSLVGNETGGGLGAGDVGLAPSKGVAIEIPEQEEFKIQDGLDPDVISSRIKKYLPQIQHCYEQQLVSKPKLHGKVTVAFTIQGDGSVASPQVAETSLKDKLTEKCMLEKIQKWTFPKPRGGGTVGVKYPFILMSNNGN